MLLHIAVYTLWAMRLSLCFRPRSGIMILHTGAQGKLKGAPSSNRFRPLSGIMFLHWDAWESFKKDFTKVSVPCRGLCFFTVSVHYLIYLGVDVSVPCRGLCFFTKWKKLLTVKNTSFRPLSGIMFLHTRPSVMKSQRSAVRFPSPVGDYVSSLSWWQETGRCSSGSSFRPLSGIMFLHQFSNEDSDEVIGWASVPCRGLCFFTQLRQEELSWPMKKRFRPLSGIMFLHTDNRTPGGSSPRCFRPLSGIMFLHMEWWQWRLESAEASVPCRGLCFFTHCLWHNYYK